MIHSALSEEGFHAEGVAGGGVGVQGGPAGGGEQARSYPRKLIVKGYALTKSGLCSVNSRHGSVSFSVSYSLVSNQKPNAFSKLLPLWTHELKKNS